MSREPFVARSGSKGLPPGPGRRQEIYLPISRQQILVDIEEYVTFRQENDARVVVHKLVMAFTLR